MLLPHSYLPVVAATLLALGGCSWPAGSDRYMLISASSGDVYRLHVNTGQVHKIVGTSFVSITGEERSRLHPGTVYLFEDGTPMKYLGSGRFERAEPAVITLEEYLKKPGAKERLEQDIKGNAKSKGSDGK